jgi:hypothetical protein
LYIKHEKIEKLFSIVIISLSLLTLALQLIRAFNTGFFFVSIIFLLIYFTNQSALLVFATALLIFFDYRKKWFDKFSFIAFANITITAIVFHLFLVPYIGDISFVQHLLHTVIPIIYFIYYLFFLKSDFKPINGLYATIYPIIYFIFVFIIVHPLLGQLIYHYYPNEPDMLYVYPFLNPNRYDNGFIGVMQLSVLVLLPLCAIIFTSLLGFKKIISNYLSKQKNAISI